jgi:peptidase E
MAKVNQQIVGLGGHGDTPAQTRALMRHVLALTGKDRPRVMHVPTATGDSADGMRDGLGFLAGSACPHYGGEALRRPRYSELVEEGFPEGIAADDGVGLHYLGTELREVVTCRPGAAAYRVMRAGEERLEARPIPA